MAPRMCRSTNRQGSVLEPEVYFRINHGAWKEHNGGPVAAHRNQTVEIALGPKGAFENGDVGVLRRREPTDQVVSAMPSSRSIPKPAKEPRTPRVVELLRKAIEWQGLLESGTVANQTEIAYKEGFTRARVTQVMGLLRLGPEIREKILSMPKAVRRSSVTERVLRPITAFTDSRDQLQEFHKLLEHFSISLKPQHSTGPVATETSQTYLLKATNETV